MAGQPSPPAAADFIGAAARLWGLAPAVPVKPERGEADRRFDAPEWEQHPFFRLLKQSYLALSKQLLEEAERQAVDPDERQRLVFYLRQFLYAISPTSFLPTNPAALRKAWETGGGSVADGLRNLLDDLRQGRLSITDTAAFAPGKNLATTQGKVVYRNRLIELIHYAPMTAQTYADRCCSFRRGSTSSMSSTCSRRTVLSASCSSKASRYS